MAVLDPRHISGRGPATEPYIPDGIPPAAIRSYVLFRITSYNVCYTKLLRGGFALGYVLGAFLTGWLTERMWSRLNAVKAFVAGVAGGIGMVYLLGIPWLGAVAFSTFRLAAAETERMLLAARGGYGEAARVRVAQQAPELLPFAEILP